MGALISLIAVAVLAVIAWVGVGVADLRFLFGVLVPGFAFFIFIVGIVYRMVKWARAPVPFRIPTTCGQQKTLPWLRNEELDNPSSSFGVIARMALEVLFFRSLFRNHEVEVSPEREKVSYIGTKFLWAAGMAFHWCMLVVVLRHFRFFVEPVPRWVEFVQMADGFFQVGVPVIYATTVIMVAALLYLLGRRLFDAKVRYISLASDYFALFLLIAIGLSGVMMRHFEKVDVIQVPVNA